jgi:L-ascorbate metabolism protein UlaG (beta-lactamase superfamily)
MNIKRRIRQMALILLLLLGSLAIGACAYVRHPKFGQLPGEERREAMTRSPNHTGGEFRNQEPSPLNTGKKSQAANLLDFLFVKKERLRPDAAVPVTKTNLASLPRDRDTIVWLGHSSYFAVIGGKRLLIDPVFSEAAAPFSFLNKAFAGTSVYTADDMPEIDYLLITHDHWDHLDYPSIKALKSKIGKVITGLGVGAHFERWGYEKTKIHEADWFDALKVDPNLTVHLLPARHFSGRMFKRNQTLWVGFALETRTRRILFSGDTGYGKHFAEIGRRFGSFDLVVLDMGQYDPNWAHVHMFPEEAAQAAEDLNAAALMPGHVGRFSISNHAWDDPFKRIATISEGKSYRLVTPTIGAPLDVADKEQRFQRWWEAAGQPTPSAD